MGVVGPHPPTPSPTRGRRGGPRRRPSSIDFRAPMSCVDLDPKRRPIGTAKKGRTPRFAKEIMISWRRWRLAVSINRSRETGRFGLGSDRDLSCLGSDRTWLGGGSTCLGSDRTWPRWRFDLPRQRSDVPRWRFVFASAAIGRASVAIRLCLGSDRTWPRWRFDLPRQRTVLPPVRVLKASARGAAPARSPRRPFAPS